MLAVRFNDKKISNLEKQLVETVSQQNFTDSFGLKSAMTALIMAFNLKPVDFSEKRNNFSHPKIETDITFNCRLKNSHQNHGKKTRESASQYCKHRSNRLCQRPLYW